MNHRLIHSAALAAAVTLLSLPAAARVNASDIPRISNGGTGFIGLTDSAGRPASMSGTTEWSTAATATARVPMQAGEASTMVDGRPNQMPEPLQSMGSAGAASTATMGNVSVADGMPVARHRSWGTPD